MKTLSAVIVTMFLFQASAFSQYKLEYKAGGSSPLHYKAHTTLQTIETMAGQEAKVSVLSDQLISMTSVRSGNVLVYHITVDSSVNVAMLPNGDTSRTSSPSVGQTKEARIHPNGEEISSGWMDSSFAKSPAGQMKEFGSLFFRLPAKEVGVGSNWKQTKLDTVATGGGEGSIIVTTTTDYKLVNEQTVAGIKCVKIEFSGKVNLKGSTSYQGIDFAITGAGKVSGTAMFDFANGKVVDIAGTSDQDLTMASSGEQKVTIPMNQKTTYELSLVR